MDDNTEIVVGRRKKRSLPDPVDVIPLPGYTAAYLERNDVTVAHDFVVGDKNVYGDYTNSELQTNKLYNIFFVVASSVDGTTKMSFSQISNPVRVATGTPTPPTTTTTAATSTTTTTRSTTTTRPRNTTPVPPQTPTPAPTPTSTPTTETDDVTTTKPDVTTKEPTEDNTRIIIIAVVCAVGFALLIIIIVVIAICLRKKRKPPKKQNDDFKDTWLRYYGTHFTDTKNRHEWSDIYNLNESRHVTTSETYKPEDLKVSEIHHNRPSISFEYEYRHLPTGKRYQWQVAERPQNAEKNRFDHLLAYDHSRVVLKRPDGHDYINANYIHGYDNRKRMYVAAQSPFSDDTISDFWFLVYQERISEVVFLANLEEDGITKSEQYWPDDGTLLTDAFQVNCSLCGYAA